MESRVFIKLKMLTTFKDTYTTEYRATDFLLCIEQVEAVYCADNIYTQYNGKVTEIRTASGGIYPVVGAVAEVEAQLMQAFEVYESH